MYTLPNTCTLKNYFLFLLTVLAETGPTHGTSIENVTMLLNDLLLSGNYSKYVRPVQIQSTVLEVKVGFHLISILGFDEIEDQLTSKSIISVFWEDEFLSWNPDEYGGVESFNVPSDMIWIPTIIMTSANNELSKFDVKGDNLRLYSNGTISWLHADVYKSRCLANVRNFPLDVQSCNMYFSGLGYLPTEFRMSKGVLAEFPEEFDNGQWTRDGVLVSYDPLPSTIIPIMTVTIIFHRKYLYMVLNILIPIVMLNCLCILGFFIPTESGEKITYGVTLLLSNTVFLLLLSDNLPKISDPVPTVCVYLIVSMMNSLFICLSTIVNVRIFNKTGKVTGFGLRIIHAKLCCHQEQPSSVDQGRVEVVRSQNQSTRNVGDITGSDMIRCGDEKYTWKDVSRKLDKLLFFSFTVFMIVVNITFVIYINFSV